MSCLLYHMFVMSLVVVSIRLRALVTSISPRTLSVPRQGAAKVLGAIQLARRLLSAKPLENQAEAYSRC